MLELPGHANLARRAAHLVQLSQLPGDDKEKNPYQVSPWAAIIMVLTVLAYYVALIKIRYTLGAVVSTLAIVEEPESNMLVEVDYVDEDGLDKKDTDGLLEPEVALIKIKPVTAKIRTAMALLKSRGGRHGRFRGFSLFIVYGFLKTILTGLLATVLPAHGAFIAAIAAETLLAKLKMVWVHHVISAPSSKTWIQRTRSLQISWTKIAPAALIQAVAFQYTIFMPMFLLCTYKPKLEEMSVGQLPTKDAQKAMIYLAGATLLGLALTVLVYIPAHVSFIRTAASMLPEEDQTIVSFDRTFGGKIATGERIGYWDAWKTFNWVQRRRYMGLLVKIVAIMVAVTVLFGLVMATELSVFLGPRIKDLVKIQSN